MWTAATGWQDLNTLIDSAAGIHLSQAQAINRAGQISGFGTMPATGNVDYAFLLTPLVKPDLNADGHVDGADLTLFLGCQTGPAMGPPASGCSTADFNGDGNGSVDAVDFAILQRCWSGSVLPAWEGCDQ